VFLRYADFLKTEKKMINVKQFEKQQYMSVETYRKTGEGVRTPVWFIESNGEFLFYTEETSAKVKRIRRNPAVKIAPCDMRGELKGEFISVITRLLSPEESVSAQKTYAKKYGLMGKLFELMGNSRKSARVFLAVKPVEGKQ
jgi:PPOX class probable F420-dependent enzyme